MLLCPWVCKDSQVIPMENKQMHLTSKRSVYVYICLCLFCVGVHIHIVARNTKSSPALCSGTAGHKSFPQPHQNNRGKISWGDLPGGKSGYLQRETLRVSCHDDACDTEVWLAVMRWFRICWNSIFGWPFPSRGVTLRFHSDGKSINSSQVGTLYYPHTLCLPPRGLSLPSDSPSLH